MDTEGFSGFDDPTIKEKYIQEMRKWKENNKMERISDLMNNFYNGRIVFNKEDKNISLELWKREYLKKETINEIYEIMIEYIENDESPDTKITLLTQETSDKLIDILDTIGLELECKFDIEEHKEKKNIKEFYVSPNFSIKNIDKFISSLESIHDIDEFNGNRKKLLHALEIIVDMVWKKIRGGFHRNRTNEELDIFGHIEKINAEIERIWLREEESLYQRKNLFIALEKRCLKEYKESIKLWFYGRTNTDKKESDEKIYVPLFFEDMLDKIERGNQKIQEEDITALHIEIEKYQKFMDKVKENERLYSIVSRELMVGIRQILYKIDDNRYLRESRKREIKDTFNQYIAQIQNTNPQK